MSSFLLHALACSALPLIVNAAPARACAQGGVTDSAQVHAAVLRYIDALMARDTAYIRSASLARATSVAIPDPATERDTAGVRSVDDVIAGLARETRRFVGRVWSPRIEIAGPIAVFIAPYETSYDGRFAACGVDHYIMVRSGGRWLVSQVVFTRQHEGCTPGPGARPDE